MGIPTGERFPREHFISTPGPSGSREVRFPGARLDALGGGLLTLADAAKIPAPHLRRAESPGAPKSRAHYKLQFLNTDVHILISVENNVM